MLGAATGELTSGYGAYLVQTTLALLAVCALAIVVLRLLRRRVGAGGRGLRVVARLGLEPRRSLYVIEVAGRYLLVGVGDGPMTMLAELDAQAARALEAEDGAPSWADMIKRLLGRTPPGTGAGK